MRALGHFTLSQDNGVLQLQLASIVLHTFLHLLGRCQLVHPLDRVPVGRTV